MSDSNHITALMVTIPSRESQAQYVLNRIYNQVDEIRIMFNLYEKVPAWGFQPKIRRYLNTQNKMQAAAVWMMLDDTVNGYVVCIDDDLNYPLDYVKTLVEALKRHNNTAIVTVYGELIRWPPISYWEGRTGVGYIEEVSKDILLDIVGTGCCAFHTDFVRPQVKDFPEPYSRDLWFSIYAARNNIPIIRISTVRNWLTPIPTKGIHIKNLWKTDPVLKSQREKTFMNILVPLLKSKYENSSKEPNRPLKIVSILQVCDFPLFFLTFNNLTKIVDEVYIRIDKNHTSQGTREIINNCPKVKQVIEGQYHPKDFAWREELLRMLDPVQPDLVVSLDVDEMFSSDIQQEIQKFVNSDKKAMMFNFVCPTVEGGKDTPYPSKPHMKIFKWQPRLTYLPYTSFCQIYQYRYHELQYFTKSPIQHYCFWTEDMRKAKKAFIQKFYTSYRGKI